ncbi:sigma-70 family RNA polymerase sigma factor [Thauera aromatica]|uniref:ECF Sigma factor n=1 Tax=Thauera aromatica K172 TaxID=44139 RepID=A0A2R4BQW6_THAAR|nr:sigma-70 family RNA polymerase sigma factor [Thauera aromatica]AVR89728.1 ECF Sigma factor [Thauera aromatica K172]
MSSASPSFSVAELYHAHRGWLLSWLRRRLGCPHDAGDLAHDTFVRVLLRAEHDRPREPRAYLATLAHGLLVDHLRRRDLERAYLAELAARPAAVQPSTEDLAIAVDTLHAIDRVLDGLAPKARAAYLYSRLDGLAHAEIAALLGVSVSRVRQYLATAARHCYALHYAG